MRRFSGYTWFASGLGLFVLAVAAVNPDCLTVFPEDPDKVRNHFWILGALELAIGAGLGLLEWRGGGGDSPASG